MWGPAASAVGQGGAPASSAAASSTEIVAHMRPRQLRPALPAVGLLPLPVGVVGPLPVGLVQRIEQTTAIEELQIALDAPAHKQVIVTTATGFPPLPNVAQRIAACLSCAVLGQSRLKKSALFMHVAFPEQKLSSRFKQKLGPYWLFNLTASSTWE